MRLCATNLHFVRLPAVLAKEGNPLWTPQILVLIEIARLDRWTFGVVIKHHFFTLRKCSNVFYGLFQIVIG
jgi:hypothetical protein